MLPFLIPFFAAKKVVDVVTAVTKPTLPNIIAAATPLGAHNPVQVVQDVKKAIEQPSLANIATAASSAAPAPSVAPPLQVAADVKEVAEKGQGTLPEKAAQVLLKNSVITAPAKEAMNAGIKLYLSALQLEAKDKWKPLPPVLISAIAKDYKVDLTKVKYAEGIDLKIPNPAIAFPNEIFFQKPLNPLVNEEDLHLLLHELVHQEQYERVGGLENFMGNYFSNVAIKAVANGVFDPAMLHSILDYEKEAEEKAKKVLATVRHLVTAQAPSPAPSLQVK